MRGSPFMAAGLVERDKDGVRTEYDEIRALITSDTKSGWSGRLPPSRRASQACPPAREADRGDRGADRAWASLAPAGRPPVEPGGDTKGAIIQPPCEAVSRPPSASQAAGERLEERLRPLRVEPVARILDRADLGG